MNKLQVLGAGRVQASQFAYYSFFIFLMKITENRKNDKRWGLVASRLANLLIFSDFWIKTTEKQKKWQGLGAGRLQASKFAWFLKLFIKTIKRSPPGSPICSIFQTL